MEMEKRTRALGSTVDVEEEREDRHEPQREAAKSNETKVSRSSSQERHQKN
jgi:hypothetical protein